MKKSIKDLTENDVIATPTLEDWKAVKKLFPKIVLEDNRWDEYKDQTCIRPLGCDGKGRYSPLSFYQSEGYTVHSLTDFIEYEPPFNPKLGDLVRVNDKPEPRIYLFTNNGVHYCVNSNEEKEFHKGRLFTAICWNEIYPYTPPSITLTPSQAIEKLKQLPEFTNQEIKIEG